MKLHKIRTVMSRQKGITLVELLIAVAITAVISTAAAAGIYQAIRLTARAPIIR